MTTKIRASETAMITQQDFSRISEAEFATFAANAPKGFTPVLWRGEFMFINTGGIEKMTPSKRAELTIIGRAH